MQFKSWFFNGALFRKNMTRFWPLWVLTTLAWLAGMTLLVLAAAVNGSPETVQQSVDRIVATWAGLCYLVACGNAVVAAMAVFSYRFQHRSAVAIHAMPLRRECLFSTGYLSGLALMGLPLVICLAATAVAEGALGCLNLSLLLMWFTAQLMADLFFFSLAVFCGQLTGNAVMFPLLYIGIQLVPKALSSLISTVCDTLLRGFHSFPAMDQAAQWLSPLYNLSRNVQVVWRDTGENTRQYYLHGWKYLLCYLAVSAVLWGGAMALYRRHRVETAGDVIAIPGLRPVFRYFFTFCCAVAVAGVMTTLTFSAQLAVWSWKHVVIYLALAVAGGFLGYFSAQMMMSKTLKVFRKGWLGYGICMLVLVAAMCSVKADVFGFARWVPDADEVVSVELLNSDVSLEGEDAIRQVVALHASVVDSLTREQQLVQEYYTSIANECTDEDTGVSYIDGVEYEDWTDTHQLKTITILYHMRSGIDRSRAYTIYLDEEELSQPGSPAAQLQLLVNLPEYVQTYYQDVLEISQDQVKTVGLFTYRLENIHRYSSVYVELSGEEAQMVVQAVQQDLMGANTVQTWLLDSLSDQENYTWSYLELAVSASILYGDEGVRSTAYYYGDTEWYSVGLNDSWKNTIAVLEGLGVVDDTHLLANDQIIGSRSGVDSSEYYDSATHSYVSQWSED